MKIFDLYKILYELLSLIIFKFIVVLFVELIIWKLNIGYNFNGRIMLFCYVKEFSYVIYINSFLL